MKKRIKVMKSHIADLKTILTYTSGKQHDRINEEIHNSQFELKELVRRMPRIMIDCLANLRAKRIKQSKKSKGRRVL